MLEMYKQIINILDIKNGVRWVLQHLHLNENIFVDWLICGLKEWVPNPTKTLNI